MGACMLLVCEAGTGYNNVDLAACHARGIAVCNVPTYATEAMAHMAVTFVMALACSLWPQSAALATGDRSYMAQCHLGAPRRAHGQDHRPAPRGAAARRLAPTTSRPADGELTNVGGDGLRGRGPTTAGVANSVDTGCNSKGWQADGETDSVATVASAAGYATFYAGKYLNIVFYDYDLSVNGVREAHGTAPEDYLTDLVARRAVNFLEAAAAPWFAILGTPASHDPFEPRPDHFGALDGASRPRTPAWNASAADKHAIVRRQGFLKAPVADYIDRAHRRRLECLLSVDEAMNATLAAVAARGEADATYTIFTSDHGWHLGEFGLNFDKRQLYEFDTRVPFVLAGPGVQEGVVLAHGGGFVDFLPTLYDMIHGSPPPAGATTAGACCRGARHADATARGATTCSSSTGARATTRTRASARGCSSSSSPAASFLVALAPVAVHGRRAARTAPGGGDYASSRKTSEEEALAAVSPINAGDDGGTYHADADLHYYKVGAFIKPWKLGTGVPGVLERLGDVWRVDEWDNTYHCLRHLQPGNESVFCVFECFDELHEPKACAAGTPESGRVLRFGGRPYQLTNAYGALSSELAAKARLEGVDLPGRRCDISLQVKFLKREHGRPTENYTSLGVEGLGDISEDIAIAPEATEDDIDYIIGAIARMETGEDIEDGEEREMLDEAPAPSAPRKLDGALGAARGPAAADDRLSKRDFHATRNARSAAEHGAPARRGAPVAERRKERAGRGGGGGARR
ncbi:sulfuric ester hydrolase [Aureococcus anophagefferens]|nr:sulfuric ester hydrolase [Aureococcus anophagefferens]